MNEELASHWETSLCCVVLENPQSTRDPQQKRVSICMVVEEAS